MKLRAKVEIVLVFLCVVGVGLTIMLPNWTDWVTDRTVAGKPAGAGKPKAGGATSNPAGKPADAKRLRDSIELPDAGQAQFDKARAEQAQADKAEQAQAQAQAQAYQIPARDTFCGMQQMVSEGEVIGGEDALAIGAASMAMAYGLSNGESRALLLQAKEDYQDDKFTIDDCDRYHAAVERGRKANTVPF